MLKFPAVPMVWLYGGSMSTNGKPRLDSTPIAEAGLIVTDLSLNPILIDEGAMTIMSDLSTEGAHERRPSVPAQIAEALKGWKPNGSSRLRVELQGLQCTYHCHAYRIESQNFSSRSEPMIALHFQKGHSADGWIDQFAAECSLTEREVHVLRCISLGFTSKEVAARMQISPNTVKSYIRLIMVKMGVNTRSGIVGKVLDHIAKGDASPY
jgi:DNA-binding CsgD family transcriptional regulator